MDVWRAWAGGLAGAVLLAALVGCPAVDGGGQVLLEARITISTDRGPAPLTIVVSGEDSLSRDGIVEYAWDFAGRAAASTARASHTFDTPGRYDITLIVTDAAGRQSTARLTVRSEGGSAVAVITATTTTGSAPLTVGFNGAASFAEDDAIFDYFWDFGDGGRSTIAAPIHTYASAGEFTVTLRVVSGGGAEGTARATILVGQGGGSLQFSGSQRALLPLSAGTGDAFTFESWFRADAEGGTLVTFGTPEVALAVLPASNRVQLRIGGSTQEAPAFDLAGAWRHIALTHGADGATVYLDGAPLAGLQGTGEVGLGTLRLGGAYRGKLARVRFWSVERSATEIASNANVRLVALSEALLGDWLLDERAGQTLANRKGGPSGTLGDSTALELADPAWSSDAP
jgi:chitodextrinase